MKTLKTVLQVEDDPNDVCLLSHALHKAAIECHLRVASDGAEAIQYLQRAVNYAGGPKQPMPSLILLDLKLPRVMGLEVLKWIRKQLGNRIPVVVLTASPLESDIAKAFAYGANAFLIKPAKNSELQSMLKTTCDFWLTYNTLSEETTSQFPTEGVVSLNRLGSRNDPDDLELLTLCESNRASLNFLF